MESFIENETIQGLITDSLEYQALDSKADVANYCLVEV
jgi:hypothetical protein